MVAIVVHVQPRSSKNALEWGQGGLKAKLTAPPVDGAANAALIELLADRLALPKRSITIVRGATSRHKMVEIVGITMEDVKKRLQMGQ